jgi:hypothetical protein
MDAPSGAGCAWCGGVRGGSSVGGGGGDLSGGASGGGGALAGDARGRQYTDLGGGGGGAPGASAISRLSRRAASRCRRRQSMDRSPVGAGIRPSWRCAQAPLSAAGRSIVAAHARGDGTTSRRSTRGYITSQTPPSRWGRDRESGGGGRSYESPPPPPPTSPAVRTTYSGGGRAGRAGRGGRGVTIVMLINAGTGTISKFPTSRFVGTALDGAALAGGWQSWRCSFVTYRA